ncbi:GntR family transcriptional regulator [Streptomyces sp. Isolate_219]|uniref:GntR family transcriptional regulator n=1 Tax=Streptomyces sp. Isolate_219 TaxID=2950110 RepID=UPI0021CA713F|nr:GntR family transcriptional regulator [Streptomyces sp. Isolate_219]MCR8573085.1 GntR family transcriptional regulator [Streptomyces sp. Isolate_219]
MSTQNQQQAGGASSPPAGFAATRRALRNDQLSLRRIGGTRSAASSAAVFDDHARIDRHTAVWVPLAECRREDAAGSPADRARWDRLIKAAARPAPADMSYERLVVRVGSARDLLRAVADALSPSVPVVEVALWIEQRITSGAYPPGAALAPGRVAAELAVPLESVQLALTDLSDKGVIEWQANCRARVPGAHRLNDRPRQIAHLLRVLVTGGAFPPGAVLPVRRELSRMLVTVPQPLVVALRLLVNEGLLERDDRQRLTVCRDAVERATPQLPAPAGNVKSLRQDEIREAARKARRWWSTRISPAPAALDQVIDQLSAAAGQLVDRARRGPLPPSTTDQELEARVARTAIMAAAVHQPHFELRLWHTACLATDLLDFQAFVDRVDENRPVSSTAMPL